MKLIILMTIIFSLSTQVFASRPTLKRVNNAVILFTCDEGEITLEEKGDYFFGSRALIYSDEGKTKVISDTSSEFHVYNKDTFLVPPVSPDGKLNLNIFVTTTIEINIDIQSGEGVIVSTDEDKNVSETTLSNCIK